MYCFGNTDPTSKKKGQPKKHPHPTQSPYTVRAGWVFKKPRKKTMSETIQITDKKNLENESQQGV